MEVVRISFFEEKRTKRMRCAYYNIGAPQNGGEEETHETYILQGSNDRR